MNRFLPRYGVLGVKRLEQRGREAKAILSSCTLCPRLCRVNRLAGELGFCGMGSLARVASSGPHFGEERVLIGTRGSGTIFFAGCTLRCVFCQNWQISWRGQGTALGDEDLAQVMLLLARFGCANINLVSPTHFLPQILVALALALGRGLRLPLIYNTSGYETVETLALLDDIVDIYMPDIKYAHDASGNLYSAAPDYASRTRVAVLAMQRQVGDLAVDAQGVAYRGLLVRHLVMPGDVAGTEEVLRFLAEEVSQGTAVNVMGQYRPAHLAQGYPPLNRLVSAREYQRAVQRARELGLKQIKT